jgi:hypothetical protein
MGLCENTSGNFLIHASFSSSVMNGSEKRVENPVATGNGMKQAPSLLKKPFHIVFPVRLPPWFWENDPGTAGNNRFADCFSEYPE